MSLPLPSIDFLSPQMRYRIMHASLKKELLARALGVKPKDKPTIVDVTAGLGRDAFVLAALGFELTLVERSDVLYVLLRDALQRAKEDEQMAPIASRLTLIHADARDWLPTAPKFQIVYLDPMFPKRQKSALVKKDMLALQQLLGDAEEGEEEALLPIALACANQRVVIKRPRYVENNEALQPSYSLFGQSARFDIYVMTSK